MKRSKVRVAGAITVYILILVGMVIGFYLMGFRSPALSIIEASGLANTEGAPQNDTGVAAILGLIGSEITKRENWAILGAISGLALLGAVLSGGDSIISFLGIFLPMFILLAVANILFFPITTLTYTADTAGISTGPIGVILSVVFNVLLFLAVIEFLTGRQ